MTHRTDNDDGEKGARAPDPMKSDLGRTDDVPDVNASDTGGVTTPNKAVENVE
jgi:hypothetical protein